jgi:phage host-nuclease inhibitor protein Gam
MAKKANKRHSAPALDVPQTIPAGVAMLARYAELGAGLDEITRSADRSKAAIDAHRDELASPVIAEMKAIQKAMKPFWEARKGEITGGKRKSVVLGGCEIGTRLGNPTLDYPKGTDEELICQLIDPLGFDWAVREKLELDKLAILGALRLGEDELGNELDKADAKALAGLGFAVKQTETFFIDRVTSEPAEAATIGREAA